jgi:hypothetical protein
MPAFQENYLRNVVIPFATDISQQGFTPYEGQMVADFSPLALGASNLYSSMIEPSAARTQATELYSGIAQPTEFGQQAASLYGDVTRGTAGEQAAAGLYGDIAGFANLTPADYAAMTEANLSPYTSNVIDAALARSARERDIARTGEMADITRSRAFGNERRGVYEAERQAAYELGRDQMIADLMQQGYSQAQAATMAQLQQQQGAAATGAAGLAQLGAAERAALQAGAAGFAGLSQAERAAAATAAGGLSQAEQARLAALQSAAAGQTQLGTMQQATEQAALEAAYNQYLMEQNYPLTQLGALTGAAGVIPSGYGTTTGTSSSRPGFSGILGAVGSLGQGLGAMGATLPFSDKRLKKNVKQLAEINGVKYYTWEWNDAAKAIGAGDMPRSGVIADELKEIHPDLVIRGDDGYLRVDYAGLAKRQDLQAV